MPGFSLSQILSLLTLFSLFPASAVMQPQTSMVLINESAGGGSINVTNTDDKDALLYVKVIDLADDKKPRLVVTQPVVRVAAGGIQRVRFILTTEGPLTTEHLKRVTFEGIPLVDDAGQNRVDVNIRQNLPVIIHPRGLPENPEPWKVLNWSLSNGQLTVHNPGAYVVRMGQDITVLPAVKRVQLPQGYLLPGQKLTLSLAAANAPLAASKVRFATLSDYGFKAGEVEQPIATGR